MKNQIIINMQNSIQQPVANSYNFNMTSFPTLSADEIDSAFIARDQAILVATPKLLSNGLVLGAMLSIVNKHDVLNKRNNGVVKKIVHPDRFYKSTLPQAVASAKSLVERYRKSLQKSSVPASLSADILALAGTLCFKFCYLVESLELAEKAAATTREVGDLKSLRLSIAPALAQWQNVRERVVMSFYELSLKTARKACKNKNIVEDVAQSLLNCVVDCFDVFDRSKGAQFATFVFPYFTQKVKSIAFEESMPIAIPENARSAYSKARKIAEEKNCSIVEASYDLPESIGKYARMAERSSRMVYLDMPTGDSEEHCLSEVIADPAEEERYSSNNKTLLEWAEENCPDRVDFVIACASKCSAEAIAKRFSYSLADVKNVRKYIAEAFVA